MNRMKQGSIQKVQKVLIGGQVFFWVSYFMFFVLYEKSFMSWQRAFLQSSKFFVVNITLVYVHMYGLMPLLIHKKKYLRYSILLILLITTMVYAELSIERWMYTNPRRLQYINQTPHLIYLVGMDVIVIMISAPIKFALDYFRLQAKQQQTANQQLIAEMKYLKLQINPHFLFNTLNSLYYLTQNKSDLAPDVVQKLAHLMRYMLEKGSEESVALSDEIAFVEAYLQLEKIRIAQCEIQFTRPEALPSCHIPPLLFIPLVENAFKHGIDKSSDNNFVHLSLVVESKSLTFTIQNALLDIKNETGSGIGLANLQKRLTLLYQSRYTLDTQVKGRIFHAVLQIPLNNSQ
ncbi:MAG TPA: hypothetical protein DCS93_16600 [Microscillaceae bacterium]|nr:hypothetical protein [Microscillaceae bacterium]